MPFVANRPAFVPLLPLLAIACGALALLHVTDRMPIPYIGAALKPSTTLLILLHAARRRAGGRPAGRWILAGLALSVVAESSMIVPGGWTAGTCVFAAAHACYLLALRMRLGSLRLGRSAFLHALLVGWLISLWADAYPLRAALPVALFLAVLGFHAAVAEAAWSRPAGGRPDPAAGRAAKATACWMAADTVLSVSLFVAWIPGTYVWVFCLYWAAQWQFAALVGEPRALGAASGAASASLAPARAVARGPAVSPGRGGA